MRKKYASPIGVATVILFLAVGLNLIACGNCQSFHEKPKEDEPSTLNDNQKIEADSLY